MALQLDFFALTVSDMARSLAFYRRLGLDLPSEADQEPHVEVTLPGGVRLAWDTVEVARSIDPNWQEPSGSPRIALAFRCDSPSEVDATYRGLTELGYQGIHEPWDAPWGQRYATVLDPDGNAVDLYCPLPASDS